MHSDRQASKAIAHGASVSWEVLKKHGLLRVLNWPPFGGAVLTYLFMLEDSVKTSSYGRAWNREIQALIAAVTSCNLADARVVTNRDLTYPYVKVQSACHRAREAALYTRKACVDQLYVRCVLYFSAQGKLIPLSVLKGLTQLYRYLANTSKGSQLESWRYLVDALENKEYPFSDHIRHIKKSGQRSFAIKLERIFKAPLPTPSNIKTLADIEFELNKQSLAQAHTTTEAIQTRSDAERQKSRPRQDKNNEDAFISNGINMFQRGASVLRYLISGTAYQSRSQRLGMSSRDAIPIEHMSRIAKALVHLFEQQAPSPPQEKDANLLALLQLSLPLPFHVLMNVSLVDIHDIKLDLDNGCIKFNMGEMLELADWGEKDEKQIVLPLPVLVANALRQRWLARPTARYLGDLFDVQPNVKNWAFLEQAHRAVLKRCSDPKLKVWPSKWVGSVGNVYSHVLGDALEAAVCGLSPRLTTTNALYYFHPKAKDLERSSHKVFHYLGVGPVVRVVNESFVFSEKNPTDETLRSGFEASLRALKFAAKGVKSSRTLKSKLDCFNETVRLSAALLIFSYGGRGSKISELTNGSVYASSDFLHVDDKHVGQERDSRLVPKTQLAHKVLELFGLAQEALAHDLVQVLPKNKNEIWYEISKSEYRFNGVAFNTVSIEGRIARRKPVEAADVKAVAQIYFQSSRNFMRHVIVTKWTLDHLDHNLLRVITGHATSGLEMPAGASVYSPASAIQAAGLTLEKVLQTWISPALVKRQKSFSCGTLSIPLEKMTRLAKSFHSVIEKGNSGPLFSQWHLAAQRLLEEIRGLLLAGSMPQDQWAAVLLHVIIFDGFTERVDLEAIFKAGEKSFEFGANGWRIRWSRQGDKDKRFVPAQSSTASFLQEQSLWTRVSSIADAWGGIDLWLSQQLCLQFFKQDKHGVSLSEALLGIVTLWLDLHTPTILQLAYAACQHAPIPTTRSSLKLLGDKGVELLDSIDQRSHESYPDQHLGQFFRIIHKIGSNHEDLGGLKARANQYDLAIAQIMPVAKGSLLEALHLCVCLNNELIRNNRNSRLEFSSISTYLGYLRSVLSEFAQHPIAEFTEIDFFDFSRALLIVVGGKDAENDSGTTKIQRRDAQAAAATWFLKSLQSIGYPVPDAALEGRDEYLIAPSITTSVTHINDVELQAAKGMSQHWNCEDSLRVARLDSAISLLKEVPLRWMECAALTSSSLLTWSSGVVIKPSGLSHIKSASGQRILPITSELQYKLATLQARIDAMNSGVNSDVFLFLDKRENKSIGSSGIWLHRSLTDAMSWATGDERCRIHHLRARAINRKMFIDWERTFDGWQLGQHGPIQLRSYFEYTPEKAWRADEVRILAGHAYPSTTVLFYLYSHHLVRAMALAALSASTQPSEAMWQRVEAHGGSHGLSARDTLGRRDAWLHFNRQLYPAHVDGRVLQTSAQKEVPGTALKSGSIELTTHMNIFAAVIYVYLRILDRSTNTALDISGVTVSQGKYLDEVLRLLKKRSIFKTAVAWISQADVRSRESIGRFYNASHFKALFSAFSQQSSSDVHNLINLFGGVTPTDGLIENLFDAATSLNSSEFCIEIINDVRYVDPELNARLGQHHSIRIGVPIKRQGKRAAIYLVHRDNRLGRLTRHSLQRTLLILLVSIYGVTHLNERALDEKS